MLLDLDRSADVYLAAEQQQWDAQAETYEERRIQDFVYMAGFRSAVANLGCVRTTLSSTLAAAPD